MFVNIRENKWQILIKYNSILFLFYEKSRVQFYYSFNIKHPTKKN